MTERETVIEIHHLQKRFKKVAAVKDLSLQVHRGDVFGFLGPNGAGKSTTIRIMLDLVRPTGGEVKLFGLNLKSDRHRILGKIGALVEKPDFYSYLSGRRNLQLFGKMLGNTPNSQIDGVLELVQLADRANDKVKTYSHGMKQRLGIAHVLLGDPELIILDEPTVGLDPAGMKEIRELIQQLVRKGTTIFLSSHLLHEVEQVCTQMAVINKGELIVAGSVRELLSEGPTILLVEVNNPAETAIELAKLPYVNKILQVEPTLRIELPHSKIPELNQFLVAQNCRVSRLQPQTSLEDYYLSLVQN